MRIFFILILMLQILNVKCSLNKNKDVFILKDTKLYQSDNIKSKVLYTLHFPQKIKVKEARISNYLINVTTKSKDGWIYPMYTSIPDTWTKFNEIEEIYIHYPSKYEFTL